MTLPIARNLLPITSLLPLLVLGLPSEALAQGGPEELSLDDAIALLAQDSGEPPPTARFTTAVTQFDGDWLATLYGCVDITERLVMNVELDTQGYLAVGAGYGFSFTRAYVEPYVDYGRSDLIDLYDLGVFGALAVAPSVMAYLMTAHQWRDTTAFPLLAPSLFDQTEWLTTVGVNYQLVDWMDADLSLSHCRLLSGNRGLLEVANDNITSASLALTVNTEPLEPFVRFTVGEHRVRPGDPVITDSSFEFGVRFAAS